MREDRLLLGWLGGRRGRGTGCVVYGSTRRRTYSFFLLSRLEENLLPLVLALLGAALITYHLTTTVSPAGSSRRPRPTAFSGGRNPSS
jgi:hypothetical protein